MTDLFDQAPAPAVSAEMDKLAALSPAQLGNLEDLQGVMEDTAEIAVAEASKATESTKRTLGTIVVGSLTSIVGGTLGLLAFVVFRGDQAMLDAVIASIQPGTILVAGLAAISGIAAGAGLGGSSKE